MENEFLPYELAVKLKKLGFDEPCLAGFRKYGDNMVLMSKIKDNTYPRIETVGFGKYCHQNKHIVKAPLWQQAFDWFRIEKGFDLSVNPMSFVGYTQYYDIHIHHSKYVWDTHPMVTSETYEEARQSCLEKLITLI